MINGTKSSIKYKEHSKRYDVIYCRKSRGSWKRAEKNNVCVRKQKVLGNYIMTNSSSTGTRVCLSCLQVVINRQGNIWKLMLQIQRPRAIYVPKHAKQDKKQDDDYDSMHVQGEQDGTGRISHHSSLSIWLYTVVQFLLVLPLFSFKLCAYIYILDKS